MPARRVVTDSSSEQGHQNSWPSKARGGRVYDASTRGCVRLMAVASPRVVLAGVSLWREFDDREDKDERIRAATSAIARVLLPTITVPGTWDECLSAL